MWLTHSKMCVCASVHLYLSECVCVFKNCKLCFLFKNSLSLVPPVFSHQKINWHASVFTFLLLHVVKLFVEKNSQDHKLSNVVISKADITLVYELIISNSSSPLILQSCQVWFSIIGLFYNPNAATQIIHQSTKKFL